MKEKSLRQATLCLLLKEDKILLAMKKRSFGEGKWNGSGGKPKPGESVENAAIRETKEEIGVSINTMQRVAILNFGFEDKTEWDQEVTVFIVDSWIGEPVETEEMRPKWFDRDKIPYELMWPDDKHWLPLVLEGKHIFGQFEFDKEQHLKNFSVKEIDSGLWPE